MSHAIRSRVATFADGSQVLVQDWGERPDDEPKYSTAAKRDDESHVWGPSRPLDER